MGRITRRWGPPAVLSLLLLTLGFPALRQYNVTWDEALGDFFFGQRFWSYLTTWDPIYLDFAAEPYPPDHVPNLSSSELRRAPNQHYFVGGTLAAATSALMYNRLGLLDPFDGYHAVNLLLAVPLIFLWYGFVRKRFGLVPAVLAPALLLLSPRVVCDLMANVKDFPGMVFFTVTLFAFLPAYEAGSFVGIVATGALWGIALGARTNALFIAPIVGLVFLTGGLPINWRRYSRALLALLIGGCVGVAVLVAVWPYTWDDPFHRLWEHFVFLTSRKDIVRPESIAPPLPNILFTTPLPLLVLFLIGLGPALRKALERDRAALLLLFWIIVVVGRLLLPGAVNYDGVRHFLELFPALATVAALGASWCVDLVDHHFSGLRRFALRTVVLVVPLTAMVWTLVSVHPFEIAYWNELVGGLGGAQTRRMAQSCDYWGTSYRLGIDWLNANAPPNTRLVVPLMEHTVRLVAQQRLRPDIQLLHVSSPVAGLDPRGWMQARRAALELPVYVMFVPRDDWMNDIMREMIRTRTPVKEWRLDGAPLLLIYRYDSAVGPS